MDIFTQQSFANKVAFISGGTSGINLGIAQRLAELGAFVALVGRDAEKAGRAACSIGNAAIGISSDVRDYDATRAALDRVASLHGGIDIVIAGAAGNFLSPAAQLSANGFRTVVDIDLNGSFNVFRGSFEFLRRPGASLLAITAGQAVNPVEQQAHVGAAKAGVNQLVRSLALEWGPEGVRVNALSPGPINGTEGMARLTPDPIAVEARTARIPLRRYGEIGEVADCAVFLLSDAATYVTGAILDCDGGAQLAPTSRMGA